MLNLQTFKINGLDKITDEATVRICIKNKKLDCLELCKCDKLTPDGIDQIIKALNCLKTINVNLIPKVTPTALQEALDLRPNLKLITYISC